MNLQQQQSVLTIAMLAAFADGAKDDTEREEIRRIAQSLAAEGNMPDLPRLYQDVLLRRTSLESAAAALQDPTHRQLAAISSEGILGSCPALPRRAKTPMPTGLERFAPILQSRGW